ncbi:MAG: adenosine kinase [Spirochaetales bacterium]|nr:adenosine kinase [Spirochaetales bacterium]
MNKLQVLGIGNILIDILADVSDEDILTLGLDKGIMKLVEEEERNKILDLLKNRTCEYICGGSAPNTVITLAALGVSSGLSGKVGRDELADKYLTRLKDQGVRSYLSRSEGDTGTSIILITPDSERTMNTSLGINRFYSKEDVNSSALAEADYFYFTGYMWDTDSQKKALLEAINDARMNRTKIVFDLADPFAVNRSREDFLNMIHHHYDIVFANREEAKLLFNTECVENSVKELAHLCEIAVVKDGGNGSYVASGGKVWKIPVFKVDAVDSTGAGDTYAAGFLYGLSQGYSLEKSGLFASWLASRIVTIKGAQFPEAILKTLRKAISDGSWERS